MTLLTARELALSKWMQETKIAANEYRAANIIAGFKNADCDLTELGRDDAERVLRLYRDWRNSGIYGKRTAPCFEEAINGRDVPLAVEMFSDEAGVESNE